jgi:hypothetical protein
VRLRLGLRGIFRVGSKGREGAFSPRRHRGAEGTGIDAVRTAWFRVGGGFAPPIGTVVFIIEFGYPRPSFGLAVKAGADRSPAREDPKGQALRRDGAGFKAC